MAPAPVSFNGGAKEGRVFQAFGGEGGQETEKAVPDGPATGVSQKLPAVNNENGERKREKGGFAAWR